MLAAVAAAFVALALLGAAGAAWFGKAELWAKLLGPVHREPVDFATLRKRPSPNQFLVCPPDLCREPGDLAAPSFAHSAEELRDRWLARIGELPRVTLLAGDPDRLQYDFEVRTPLLGFPDAVTVRFLARPNGGSTLAVYSRSHYGHSDLGANEKRIRDWLQRLAH